MMYECKVDGCRNPAKARGWCGKHYMRWRTHGNLTTNNKNKNHPHRKHNDPCSVEGCENIACVRRPFWMCNKHWQRYLRHGDTTSRIKQYGGSRIKDHAGYIKIRVNGKYKFEHVVLAEKALGHSLPKGAEVHHMNRIKDDNFTPLNLVICPSAAYHALLHKRARELGYEPPLNRANVGRRKRKQTGQFI